MDNSGAHLSQASAGYREPITSRLLRISQKRMNQTTFLDGILENLECFFFQDRYAGKFRLFRDKVSARQSEGDYVALSYTWSPSAYENGKSGKYLIQDRSGNEFYPSNVRDCVLDRITNYMRFEEIELLWIDRHSIPQKICRDPTCSCWRCSQKRESLQSMDLVYKLSQHPVALLGRPMKSEDELDILCGIIKGTFVTEDGENHALMLERVVDRQLAGRILSLLYQITNDLWWQRAWTFQENYKGGTEMILLISHPPSLEAKKQDCKTFGEVYEELSIKSVDFSFEATRFCAAFRNTQNPTLDESLKIVSILSRTEKYTETLQESEPMYPAIIANIEARGVTNPWDRIPIVANCCDYPVRLDIQKLEKENHSLSLSMLATCLLNGEIFYNKPSGDPESDLSVPRFLKEYHFNMFCSPPGELCLTYNKGCRFSDVSFTKAGIQTRGLVWELGPIIQIANFESKTRFSDVKTRNYEKMYVVEHLAYLVCKLYFLSYTELVNLIPGCSRYNCGENYMWKMAIVVSKAIEEGKALRLGRLWKDKGDPNPFTAIFVWEDAANKDPAFVFTSIRPSMSEDDTDRHVSLQVDLLITKDNVPHLYVNRWLLGMCFWEGAHLEEVVFPWPPALKHIRP
ncbi:hypothetical protein K445DRAFT_301441 [Daldinia sp. EC12]|nr:hypothetical protein K445DRAFT_301441 [Daldinia sp. EC12]